MNIAIIIPIYNESKIINAILSDPNWSKYNIIIVDDGSKDNLVINKQNYPVYLLRHSSNLGQGAAIQTGMDFSKSINADIAIHFDGDGQHQVMDIEKLVQPILNKEANVVIGSRFLSNIDHYENNPLPSSKRIILKIARVVQFIFTGLILSDSQNGFRALDKKALKNIDLKENRMAHAIEIIQSCVKKGLIIKEVPVRIIYSEYSLSKGQKLFNGLMICVRLLLNKINPSFLFTIIVISLFFVQFYKITLLKLNFYFWLFIPIILFLLAFIIYNYLNNRKTNKTKEIRTAALNNFAKISAL